MHLVLNGWFWGQMTTGSGQYLHCLVQYLPAVAPANRYSLVLPAALAPDPQPPIPEPWRIEFAGAPFDGHNENLAKVWFEQISFPLACRRLRGDVAHAPYWGSSWWRPCRTAVTVHDLIPLLLPEYRGGVQQRLYTRLVSSTARRAHVVLTDSQASRQDIIQHLRISAGRVHAVLLAADEPYRPVVDPAELQRVSQKYELPSRFILYLGGFDVRKNVPRLVRAYARLARRREFSSNTPHLVIAGKLPAADTAFTPDPRPVVAEEGVGQWVRFTGWVDEADKPALYTLAALFAFPSLYEGFGLPVAEAAACGAPVLTANRSSLPEVAPNAVLVDPEDVDSIADGLASALSRPSPTSNAGITTWQTVARATLEALQP